MKKDMNKIQFLKTETNASHMDCLASLNQNDFNITKALKWLESKLQYKI